MSSQLQPVSSANNGQQEMSLYVTQTDMHIKIFETVNNMIEKSDFFPINVLPHQRLIITDIPKDVHTTIVKIINAGGRIENPLKVLFASRLPEDYYVYMKGTNGVTLDFLSDGTLAVSGKEGVLISVCKNAATEESKQNKVQEQKA